MQFRKDYIKTLKGLKEMVGDMNYHLSKADLIKGDMYYFIHDKLVQLGDPEAIECEQTENEF